ncbi:hypothetical protein [Plantactinospora sp. B5E13]|uniref:hypothetical protein n=1 Tax=unclassified Plantactinospora TaxID=2631981 RepID=UPI00325E113D
MEVGDETIIKALEGLFRSVFLPAMQSRSLDKRVEELRGKHQDLDRASPFTSLDLKDLDTFAIPFIGMADSVAASLASPVGEYERAFFADQLTQMMPVFQRHRVRLWLPELDGPVDFDDPAHLAAIRLLGAQSKREVLRARFRLLAAMRAQAGQQGRYLGGRPPYEYRLVDAGPHPNGVHAEWGRRLHKLEPEPDTAPHVRWMSAQRLAGRSLAGIARQLNDSHVPCPSGADRERNRHR